METLDKALSLVFQKMWASSFSVTEVFYWSEIIAPVERSLSDSVFKIYLLLVERLLAL